MGIREVTNQGIRDQAIRPSKRWAVRLIFMKIFIATKTNPVTNFRNPHRLTRSESLGGTGLTIKQLVKESPCGGSEEPQMLEISKIFVRKSKKKKNKT